MKEATIERFSKEAASMFEAAQRERILVVRDGHPCALVVGLENKDEEDLRLEADPEFWRMIEERRKEAGGVTLAEAEKILFGEKS